MNLNHAKQQIHAKRSRHFWRVVDEDVRGFSDRSLLAAGEKLYDFRSRANLRGGNPVGFRAFRKPV